MTFIDIADLEIVERRPGWLGRFFHSEAMTFAHYEFKQGADIHPHTHEQEEVWHVLEGRLRISIGGEMVEAGPGVVAIVPSQFEHAVVALSDGKATVVDTPRRAIPGV